MKRLYSLIFVSVLLAGCQDRMSYQTDFPEGLPVTKAADFSDSSPINEPYTFLSEKDSEIWAKTTSIEERFSVCEVPEDILTRMTTDALVRTLLKYPLNVIYSAYDNPLDAVELVFKNSALHRELSARDDAAEVLLHYFASTSIDKSTKRSTANKSDFGLTYVNELFFEYFLASRLIPELYKDSNEPLIHEIATRKLRERRADASFSEVSVQPLIMILGEDPDSLDANAVDSQERLMMASNWTWHSVFNKPIYAEQNRTELTDDESLSLLYNYYMLFPNSIVSSMPSNRYNANGYAWLYMEDLNVPYSPAPSMSNSWVRDVRYNGIHQIETLFKDADDDGYKDDIYEICSASDAKVVYYQGSEHSAIVLPNGKHRSKWGNGPLMEHNPADCPYDTTGMVYFRIRTEPISSGCSISGDTQVSMNSTHYYTFQPSPLRSVNYQWSVENITTGNSSYVLSNPSSYTCSVTFMEASTYIIHFDAYLIDYFHNSYHIVSVEKVVTSTAP